jgi:hypothetical protein
MLTAIAGGVMGIAAVLEFREDWTIQQSHPLVAGDHVVVRYHRARLAGHEQLSRGGTHKWTLSGFCSLNGSPPQAFELGGRSSDEVAEQLLTLSADGTMEVWFERSDLYGEHHYDSDFGRNFRFPVLPADPRFATFPLQVPKTP